MSKVLIIRNEGISLEDTYFYTTNYTSNHKIKYEGYHITRVEFRNIKNIKLGLIDDKLTEFFKIFIGYVFINNSSCVFLNLFPKVKEVKCYIENINDFDMSYFKNNKIIKLLRIEIKSKPDYILRINSDIKCPSIRIDCSNLLIDSNVQYDVIDVCANKIIILNSIIKNLYINPGYNIIRIDIKILNSNIYDIKTTEKIFKIQLENVKSTNAIINCVLLKIKNFEVDVLDIMFNKINGIREIINARRLIQHYNKKFIPVCYRSYNTLEYSDSKYLKYIINNNNINNNINNTKKSRSQSYIML